MGPKVTSPHVTGCIPAAAGSREGAFDLIRGLCIISMACGHIAGGSALHAITHVPVWVDGAMGFVLISGLVLAIVQRVLMRKLGRREAAGRVLRRVRLLYIWQVTLAVIALALGTLVAHGRTILPSQPDAGHWPFEVLRAATLTLNPPLSILGMYVVLMLGAVGALALLQAGRTRLLLAISGIVYVADQLLPVDTSLPGQGSDQSFQLASWQFLFVLGLVIGWHWSAVREWASRRSVLVVAAVVSAALGLLAHLTVRVEAFDPPTSRWLWILFRKLPLGPGAILYTLAVGLVLYGLAIRYRDAILLRPVEMLGRRSLDCYLLTTFVALLVVALRINTESLLAEVIAIAALGACLGWVWLRDRRAARTRQVVHPS